MPLDILNEWLASGKIHSARNSSNVEGFRVSADVRKPHMQEGGIAFNQSPNVALMARGGVFERGHAPMLAAA